MRQRLIAVAACIIVLVGYASSQVPHGQRVFVVIERSHSYESVINSSSMPYLNSLASQYGLATQYFSNTHPSIGNYFNMTTGQTISNDNNFAGLVQQDNIVRHLLVSGKTWKSYAESLPYAGYTGGDKFPYIKRNNPFAYISDVVNGSEKLNLVPFSEFASDLSAGTLPDLSFITPNAYNGMDNCPSGMTTCSDAQKQANADKWLKTNIGPLLASESFQQNGLLMIVFDQGSLSDSRGGGGLVAAVLVGPKVNRAYRSRTAYSHRNLLATVLQALGVESLPASISTVSGMSDFFPSAPKTTTTSSAATTSTTSTTAGVYVSSPVPYSTVSSPVPFKATASGGSYPITAMRIYADGVSKYATSASSLSTSLSLSAGSHSIVVQAWNSQGTVYKKAFTITVSSTTSTTSTTAGVYVSSPVPYSTVSSPVPFKATASGGSYPITAIRIYADGVSKYATSASSLSTSLSLSAGSHSIVVQAWNSQGTVYKKAFTITVSTGTVSTAPASTTALHNYYVSTTGSDSNPGTATAPWLTLAHANAMVKPGDVVHVAPGTYYLYASGSAAVNTTTSGTSTARIRYVSDTKWGAKIISKSGGYTFVWYNKANYVDIVGFDISCPSCSVGIRNFASNVRMIGNHVHNIPGEPGCTSNGGAGINNGNYSAYDNDIIGNVVHDIGPKPTGSCNKIHGIYHSNLRGHIWNNITYNNSGWGITTWHAANAESIVNNVAFGNGGFNGTAYVGGGILIGDGDDPGGIYNSNVVVANNIIYKNGGVGFREYGNVGSGNTYTNNVIYANGYNILGMTHGNSVVNTVAADPQFVYYTGSYFGGDYHLKSTSPAVNKGTTRAAPWYDFTGASRSAGGAYDIGVYEYGISGGGWPYM